MSACTNVFASVAIIAMVTSTSLAEDPSQRYLVTDLGLITSFGTADSDVVGTAGINELGQVVFYTDPLGPNSTARATLWLPAPAYGLAAGPHDLSQLSGITSEAIARDINDAGVVVGGVGCFTNSCGEAIAWTLGSTGTPQTELLGFLPGGSWSSAHAIDDAPIPNIVGDAERTGDCECPQPSPAENDNLVIAAFNTQIGATMSGLITPSVVSSARARAVRTPQFEPFIAGWVECSGGPCQGDTNPCLPLTITSLWGPPTYLPTGLPPVGTGGHAIQDLNGDIAMVGWGLSAALSPCVERALFWATVGSAPTDLGAFVTTTNRTRAVAINDADPLQVVGESIDVVSGNRGVLWERDGGAWSCVDLGAQTSQTPWFMVQAHDVNDAGWIVGLGVNGVDKHLLLLTPRSDCPADLVEPFGCVDADDLLALINAFGTRAEGQIVPADIAVSGVVDTDDLLELVNAYGPCPGSGVTCVEP